MLEREKLKKLAEAVKDLPWDDRLGVWQDYWAGTDPSTILALLDELEQAERERDEAGQMVTHLEIQIDGFNGLRDKLATSEAALRTLRQASACSVTQPKVAMAGRNFAVVKMTFPTQKQAQTFKDELTKAIG